MKANLHYILKAVLLMALVCVLDGCYEDKGNYEFKPLPPPIGIQIEKITHSKGLSVDTLYIAPEVTYAGDESDLSYEWQYFVGPEGGEQFGSFKTFRTGKNLVYKVGIDDVVTGTGIYKLRLAVINNQLIMDENDPQANMAFSQLITLDVGDSRNYLGLMVLHGDGNLCDVGLIEDEIFAENLSVDIPFGVTPEYYSLFNAGEKIPGIGRQVAQLGRIHTYIPPPPIGPGPGISYILVFTDQAGVRADHHSMKKSDKDYSSILLQPSLASGVVSAYKDRTTTSTYKTFVDNDRIFYGNMYGVMQSDFDYKAAPIIDLPLSRVSDVGCLGFDELSGAFLYSNYDAGKMNIYKMPASANAGVAFDPSNTMAALLHLETRSLWMATMAVMRDKDTGSKFLVEMNFNMMPMLNMVTQGRYDMSALPEIDDIDFYAFGGGNNVNYLASTNKIYQYFYQSTNTTEKLYDFPGDETITLMKLVREEPEMAGPNADNIYYNSNRVLTVATVNGAGNGKLYAFKVDLITGELDLYNTYDGTESGGKPFGIIYDTDLKIKGVNP